MVAVLPPNPVPGVTKPLLLTEAALVLLLLQVPPEVVFESCEVVFLQMAVVPLIEPTDGDGFTITFLVTTPLQTPVPTVYVMATIPGEIGITVPVPLTAATVKSVVFQTPPTVASVKTKVEPIQTLEPP